MTSVEEIFFRGWLQPVLSERFGVAVAVLLSTLAFAALHLMGGARSPTTLVNLFLGGLLFGLLAARGGGIAGAIGAHFAYNWSEQMVLGLDPNPGVGSFGSVLDYDLAGPAWWGGSDEGLNASIAMTIALLALLVPLLVLARDAAHPPGKRDVRKPPKGAVGA
jgi:membrane protease YdiL (CAAX protease family)